MLFTLADARKVKPLDNVDKYPDDDVTAAGDAASDALQHACGVSFTSQPFEETFDGNGRCELLLKTPKPQSLDLVYVNDDELFDEIDTDLLLYPDGRVYRRAGWTRGRQNVVISGTAGWATTPPRVARAALLLTKRMLVDTAINDRTTVLTNQEGTTERFITAGGANVYDVPEANAVVAEYGLQPGQMVA